MLVKLNHLTRATSKTSQKHIQESKGYLSEFICSATFEMYDQIDIKNIISPKLEYYKKYSDYESYLLFLC